MAFTLKRGGRNVPLEVQRWQYFVLRHGIAQGGRVDGQFGLKTETATKMFQAQNGVSRVNGELDRPTLSAAEQLGYKIQPDDYYDEKKKPSFPPKPANLASPTNAGRNAALGCFKFKQLQRANRGDPDEISILGSCDGAIADWRRTNIMEVQIPEPVFAAGFSNRIVCHKKIAPHVQALFTKWAELDLLHLVIAFDGAFNPRYIRGKSPSNAGHGVKQSDTAAHISNHAFGSAMDINEPDNKYNAEPAQCPMRGCVRELVPSANELGFYWGGHFSSPDGMHFEFADF